VPRLSLSKRISRTYRGAYLSRMLGIAMRYSLLAAIMSYALIPVVEELIFRGYYQRRLAEDWGDGPAIIGTARFFTFAHRQYLIANAYRITMIASLLCLAIGLRVVFAWTTDSINDRSCHYQCSDDAALARC
jgi:membrane protease YdiL (CAAX protease family)